MICVVPFVNCMMSEIVDTILALMGQVFDLVISYVWTQPFKYKCWGRVGGGSPLAAGWET